MSGSLYSGYKYKRSKTGKKGGFFVASVIIIGVAVVIFVINIFWGIFFKGSGWSEKTTAEIPGVTFYAAGVDGISTKNKALEMAQTIRKEGGAGFVDFGKDWFVIEEIFVGAADNPGSLKFSSDGVTVDLKSSEHKEIFLSTVQSFEKNTGVLYSLILKSAREVAAAALDLYKEFGAAVAEFDRLQENTSSAVYAEILVAGQKQLLALYLLSTEKGEEKIAHSVKHGICTIKFAYLEMLQSIHALQAQ